jgi:hypothetical protein
MPETKTYTREVIERNVKNFTAYKNKHAGGLTPADNKKSLRYWSYLLKRLGNKDSITLPESVLNQIAKEI